MQTADTELVDDIRHRTRELVRELGLLHPTAAGTDLSVSGVHTIIEIGGAGTMSAKQLSERLLLEKSTISRMLKKLVERGDIEEHVSPHDGRTKDLRLSAQGKRLYKEIKRRADGQVIDALVPLDPAAQETVRTALTVYSDSLRKARCGEAAVQSEGPAHWQTGYVPGLIGAIAKLHA